MHRKTEAQLRGVLSHSARTALSAMLSLLAARLFKLPEVYWAPIATLIVVQSEYGTAWKVSVQRFAGTALGASVGALVVTYFGADLFAFVLGVFLLGVVFALMRSAHARLPEYFDRNAYGYGSVTLAIVALATHYNSAWISALHRSIEVSIGIVVGLVFMTLWPEPAPERAKRLKVHRTGKKSI